MNHISRIGLFRSGHQRCSVKEDFRKFYRKTFVLQSLFNKDAGPGLQTYQKETPTLMFSCKINDILKKIYFQEHLRKTGSICVASKYYSTWYWQVWTRQGLERVQGMYFFKQAILFNKM